MKVCIINGSREYSRLFELHGFQVVPEIIGSDLVCFTGGADVSPHLYKDEKHPYTSNNQARDQHEQLCFEQAKQFNIPCVGICRGGQFLNVMSGGRMFQHVTNHCVPHDLVCLETGETINVTSTHHQMFMPGKAAIILATANQGGEREWYDHQIFRKDISKEDFEVVYYPHTNSLCFQPHPEFYPQSRMASWFFELVKKHLFKSVI